MIHDCKVYWFEKLKMHFMNWQPSHFREIFCCQGFMKCQRIFFTKYFTFLSSRFPVRLSKLSLKISHLLCIIEFNENDVGSYFYIKRLLKLKKVLVYGAFLSRDFFFYLLILDVFERRQKWVHETG